MDIVMADPELGSVYSSEHSGFVAWLDPSTQAFWVSYVCRGGKVLNIALVHDRQPGGDEDGVWHSQVAREEVLCVAKNFHQSIKRMISMPTEDGIHVHHAKTRPPLDSFARGRTVVVGDAAHVMMPSYAAGAGIAIESAASLEVLFRKVDGKDGPTVRYRLRLFDKLRIPRCNLTMLVSNSPQDQPRKSGVVDEIRKFYQGPLPPSDALPYSKAWRDVLFGHDEFRAAETLLTDEGLEVKTYLA
ncbi:uncharacterized protein P884DRAFT_317130 [Thermothelomyces heterothallicus CBS 202.75]|uniref:uncharacterized protein n=1 Tax=Thermothelomyces heterothallicus CBS 202.75 TaxID=1149848 RepID=UPI0037441E8D